MKRHRAGKSSGSHRHTESIGPGQAASAGQVSTGGPGPAAQRVNPHMSGMPQNAANGATPKGMSTYREG